MAKLGEKLREYFDNQGITQKEVAEKIGVKPPYITKILNGERAIGKNQVDKWVTHFGLSRIWLLTGEGDMLVKEKNSAPADNEEVDSSDIHTIPLLPISAQGGTFNDFVISVKDSDCERIVSPIKGVDFAMPVSGDSMAPEYPSGSQVLIKKINEKAFIDWGRVYVLDTCNGTVIKKLYPSDNPEKLICKSINSEYPPFEVLYDDIYGIYRVLMCMSMK